VDNSQKKRTTIMDVAARAGVGKATVSYVLNSSRTRVPISEPTRQRVMKAAMECGYHPNAAARALSTNRTGHIGFILSDSITGGWANAYFATIFAGVEQAARQRGYGLNASLYNLSNIDSFVFPPKVGQRSVDGLVLTGYVQARVVSRFKEFGVPCVCIGDDMEVAELIPTVATDIVDGVFQGVEYGAKLGHVKICYCVAPSRRGREVGELLKKRVESTPSTAHCRLILFNPPEQGDYKSARPLFERWSQTVLKDRSTLILASDQAAIGFISELQQHGLQCPRDVSLLSTCNTDLCNFCFPALTAVDLDLETLGEIAVGMLIDHLEEGKPLTTQMSQSNHPCKMILRNSCMQIKNLPPQVF
jgi:DNA-binding LacI/PurR family transcriptional regulator